MEKAGERFVRLIEPCLEAYRSLDVRVVAVSEPDLGWRCDSLRAVLTPYEAPTLLRDLPQHPEVMVVQATWPINRVRDLLVSLDTGELSLGDKTIAVKGPAGPSQWQPPTTFGLREYTRREAASRFGWDWSAFVLDAWVGVGGTAEWRETRARWDSELRDLDPPWDGLADLRHSVIGLPWDQARRDDLLSIEVIAPLFLRFGPRTSIAESELIVEAEFAPTLNLEKATASVFAFEADAVVSRGRIQLSRCSEGAGEERVLVRRALRRPISGVDCTLQYGGLAADRVHLFGEGALKEYPHWAAFHAMAGGPDILGEALRTCAGGDPFEHAVAALLYLLGFVVLHPGQTTFPRDGDMPDILAFAPRENWYVVVECTVREVDLSAKITKLATRTIEMRNAMPPGFTALPVLVTRQTRDVIPPSVNDIAAKEKVAIVTAEDLDDLVRMATGMPPPGMTRDYLERRIPTGSVSHW